MAHHNNGDYARGEALLARALEELGPDRDPHRAAGLLERLAQAQFQLGRAADARTSLARAVDELPEDDQSPERARILAREAKLAMLQGRFSESIPVAESAVAVAESVGDVTSRALALNAMGTSLIQLGQITEGSERLRASIAMTPAGWDCSSGYINLADALNNVGRSREGLAAALEGLECVRSLGYDVEWMTMATGDIEWDLGDWQSARTRWPATHRGQVGVSFVYVEMMQIRVALADGRHDEARMGLARIAEIVQSSREPQFIGEVGALHGELERRSGDLVAARAAIDDALDAIEFCTEDVTRIAMLAETGATIEADAAQRARDLGDGEAERTAIALAESYVARLEACVSEHRPVEAARLASALASLSCARGAGDAALAERAATLWRELGRPYPAALTQFQAAGMLAAAGDREGATEQLERVLETTRGLGALWLQGEAEGLATRARLPLATDAEAVASEPVDEPAEDPFGLTPRERQVLELVARGATNREIGAELFMAEKTASVHVSRILAKLDVRTRTEAAAVAHRLGMA